MASRVDVLRLERVGEPKKRLIDPALQLLIERADVLGVSQRLLIRRVESAVSVAEVIAENRAYRCHSAAPGTIVSTSVSRRIGENGLVRYSVAPASKPRRTSSGRVAAVSITIGVDAKRGSARSIRQTSIPSPPRSVP